MRRVYRSARSPLGRRGRGLGLLSAVALGALLGAGQAAQALVITPSFDASWAAAAAGATTVVNNVIAEYEADFSNPVTVTIAFSWGELNGSAINSGAATAFATSDFRLPSDRRCRSLWHRSKGFTPPPQQGRALLKCW
jgi:hypothetical protein